MDWMVNSAELRDEFRQKVLNYSAIIINDGKTDVPTYFNEPMHMDTFGIRMYTEKAMYPVNTESVSVRIVNRSGRRISMGSSYLVLRKEGEKWLSLPGATVWTLELHWVPSNKIYPFPISLYPSLNAITPGVYRVVKKIDIGNNCHNWYFTAEFRIGNGTEEQDILNKMCIRDRVNSAELRDEFRQKVLNYSAIIINDGKTDVPTYFNEPMHMDTFGIRMYTEKAMYPVNTESVSVRIVNRSGRRISMGSSYLVLRKEGEKWLSLPGATVWTLELHWVPSNKIYPFPISLYPSLNAITPGVYRVVKKIDIGNNCHNWYFTAEFRIGNGTEEQDILNKEPSSKPLSEVEEETDMDIAYEVVEEMPEYPGGMSALLDFIQNNLQHDKANSPKRVIVQFIIDERGNISKPIILRSINPELDKEALRIVSLMPQWKPGRQNGKAERVRYTLPIIFNPSIKESDMIE